MEEPRRTISSSMATIVNNLPSSQLKHGLEADFRCPDNDGNIVRNQKIDTKLPREHYYRTTLPIELAGLRLKDRFPVQLSVDPGRFLCNYI